MIIESSYFKKLKTLNDCCTIINKMEQKYFEGIIEIFKNTETENKWNEDLIYKDAWNITAVKFNYRPACTLEFNVKNTQEIFNKSISIINQLVLFENNFVEDEIYPKLFFIPQLMNDCNPIECVVVSIKDTLKDTELKEMHQIGKFLGYHSPMYLHDPHYMYKIEYSLVTTHKIIDIYFEKYSVAYNYDKEQNERFELFSEFTKKLGPGFHLVIKEMDNYDKRIRKMVDN